MNYVTGPYTAMVRGQSTGLAGCVSPDCQAKPYCLRADPALNLKAPETAGMSAPGCRLYIPNERAPVNGFWKAADWIGCGDQKWRPVEPGTSPLVDGAAARVVRLRGYGDAINAQVAEGFIRAYMDAAANDTSPCFQRKGGAA